MTRKVYVFAGWEKNRRIGTLFCDRIRGEDVFSFEYDRGWLGAHPSLELDPTLPASRGRIFSPDKKIFGAFTDACPDRWGRALLKRNENLRANRDGRQRRSLTDLDYLLGVSDTGRQGGFRFSEAKSFEDTDVGTKLPIPPITDLRKLEQASLEYERGMEKDDETLRILMEPGSSLGGARPKANVIDANGEIWIAKFPSRNDIYDAGAWEKTMMDLAGDLGIHVPETKLIHLSDAGSIFLSKRFDRAYSGGKIQRIHFASAMTMLGERDGSGDETGYLDIADKLFEISKKPSSDAEELFRRAAFDIAVTNHDNHLRNHGFLLSGDQWLLSPAYDINPDPIAQTLSLAIDLSDTVCSFETLLSTAEFYGLGSGKASDIVRTTAEIVSVRWESYAKRNGIRQEERKMMAPAFRFAKQYAQEH